MPLCADHHEAVHRFHRMNHSMSLEDATRAVVSTYASGQGRAINADTGEFVPRNQRGAARDEKGRMITATPYRRGLGLLNH